MKVPCIYNGSQTGVLVATGPGLTEAAVDTVYRHRDRVVVLGCNDAYRMFPCLNVHYACDPEWWDKHWGRCRNLPGAKWTQDEPASKKYGLNFVFGIYEDGFSQNPAHIHLGSNSGYQLLGLAYLLGLRKLVLVGYNMRLGPRGERHFFGDHVGLRNTSNYNAFADTYKHATRPSLGLDVVNCTPDTALTCFRKADLEETLRGI